MTDGAMQDSDQRSTATFGGTTHMANEIVKSSNIAKSSNAVGRKEDPPRGLFGLARLRYDAWRSEIECEAELRLLTCEQVLAERRQALALTEINGKYALAQAELSGKLALAQADIDGRIRLTRAALEAEELEEELTFQRRLRQATPDRARLILGADVETQRLLLERDQLRRQRTIGAVPAMPSRPAEGGPPGQALLEAHVSDREIETLAVRAVTRFALLEPAEARQEWARWRQELDARFPAYAAEEIASRADELRGLSQ